MVGIKTVETTAKHREYNDALKAVLAKFKDDLHPMEMLALTSHLTGVLVALQDQSKVTPQEVMNLVMRNIEAGNIEAIEGLSKAEPAGHA